MDNHIEATQRLARQIAGLPSPDSVRTEQWSDGSVSAEARILVADAIAYAGMLGEPTVSNVNNGDVCLTWELEQHAITNDHVYCWAKESDVAAIVAHAVEAERERNADQAGAVDLGAAVPVIDTPPFDEWPEAAQQRLIAAVMNAHPANEVPVIDLRDGKGVA